MPESKIKHQGLVDAWGRRNNRKLKDRHCKQCGEKYKPRASIDQFCGQRCAWRFNASKTAIQARFLKQIRKTKMCWEWVGSTNQQGYGQCRAFQRQRWTAHRLSWFLHRGKIPKGRWVLHRCDNRRCVNPDHLFLGNHNSNTRDKFEKNRQSKGEACRKSLTEKQVIKIIQFLKQGCSYGRIADRFSVTKSNIYSIKKGIIWKHVRR